MPTEKLALFSSQEKNLAYLTQKHRVFANLASAPRSLASIVIEGNNTLTNNDEQFLLFNPNASTLQGALDLPLVVILMF